MLPRNDIIEIPLKKEKRKESEVTWHVAKYGDPYSEFVLCI